MHWFKSYIRAQGNQLLANPKYAVFLAVVFSLLPFCSSLAVAVVCLVTLRKGIRFGALLALAALSANVLVSSFTMPVDIVLINALMVYIPSLLAAQTLRNTRNWQVVCWTLFILATLIVLLLHVLVPDLIMNQFQQLVSILKNTGVDGNVFAKGAESGIDSEALANALLGAQMAGMVFSSLIAVMTARAVQSLIFNPGGFKQEMLEFRADKVSLIIFLVIVLAMWTHSMVAINLLPVFLLYFLLAGFSLSFNLLNKKTGIGVVVLQLVALTLVPFLMLPAYVLMGSLDALFNFRLSMRASTSN